MLGRAFLRHTHQTHNLLSIKCLCLSSTFYQGSHSRRRVRSSNPCFLLLTAVFVCMYCLTADAYLSFVTDLRSCRQMTKLSFLLGVPSTFTDTFLKLPCTCEHAFWHRQVKLASGLHKREETVTLFLSCCAQQSSCTAHPLFSSPTHLHGLQRREPHGCLRACQRAWHDCGHETLCSGRE